MRRTTVGITVVSAMIALGACAQLGLGPPSDMGFFVTSIGSGKGADFGGLAGADRHCQNLAEAAGVGDRSWRAYLSTTAAGPGSAVDARDRIGKGPWKNAEGTVIANSVAELHGPNKLTRQTALNEKGQMVNGRGDNPSRHDILTGSQPDGTASAGTADTTCRNWTSSGEGSAIVGHHDRLGPKDDAPSRSWNSSHQSRGCSDEALVSTGGAGLLYCFATN